MLVPVGVHCPTSCASLLRYFVSAFFQMWEYRTLIKCRYSYTAPITLSVTSFAYGIGCGGIHSLWVLSTITWLSCASLSEIWSQLSSSMTCVPGVSFCHTVPPMNFLSCPTSTSWFDSGGTVGVGRCSFWRRSNSIARCNNGWWRLFSALLSCTLARCACFRGNWDVGW